MSSDGKAANRSKTAVLPMSDIVFNNITVEHGEDSGLFHLSFSVSPGESYAVLAPTGAGKSTIASLLMGLTIPDEGSCAIRGHDCFSDHAQVKSLVGFMPGNPYLPPKADGEAFLKMLSSWHGGASEDKIRHVMEKLDINPLGTFSRMTALNKSKMAILFGLMYDSPILVLDEPYMGLDAFTRDALTELLLQEKSEGKTILLLTHVLQQAQKLCDRIAIMRKGRLVVEQQSEQLQFSRQKVYHITFDTAKEASRFSQEWETAVELIGERAIVAVPASPMALIKTLSNYAIKDFIGGRDEGEEAFLRYYGDDTL